METLIQVPTAPAKRNRHTPENDAKSALVKRINRLYAKGNHDRKLRIENGQANLYRISDGAYRFSIADLTQWFAHIQTTY